MTIKSFSNTLFRSTIALGFVAFAGAALPAIDLTPELGEYTAEGMKFQQLTFHENKLRIDYELPHGWSFSGGGAELRLKPPKKNFAEAEITTVSLSKPQPLDENVRASLKEKFLATLPAGSQLVKIEQEIESPVLVNGNPTFEIIASYQLIGEKFCRSALFANVHDSQLVFRFSSRKEDFDSLHGEFRASILSWHWLDAADQESKPAATNGSAQ